MIVTASIAFCGLCGLFLFSAFKKLNVEQQKASIVDPIYAPVESAEKRFNETKKRYETLKSEYSQNLKNLKDTETKQSLYELGIGTTDQSLYVAADESTSFESLQA